MAYRIAPFPMTLSDLQGHSPTASLQRAVFRTLSLVHHLQSTALTRQLGLYMSFLFKFSLDLHDRGQLLVWVYTVASPKNVKIRNKICAFSSSLHASGMDSSGMSETGVLSPRYP